MGNNEAWVGIWLNILLVAGAVWFGISHWQWVLVGILAFGLLLVGCALAGDLYRACEESWRKRSSR